MAYKAEIEIGVKGAKQLEDFKARLIKLRKTVEQTNKREIFGSKQVTSVNEYNAALVEATDTLNQARIQLDGAGKATKTYKKLIEDYVEALGLANQSQDIQNRAIQEEIQLRTEAARAATLQAAGIREVADAYASPIGPGPASSIDALVGQSSPVSGRVERLKNIENDDRALQQALLDLEKKSAEELNKKVKLQEDLVEGTREVLELAAEAQRKQQSGEYRTQSATRLAQETLAKAEESEANFKAREKFAADIFNIEKNFDKKLRDTQIDNLLERFKLEENLSKNAVDRLLQAGEAEGRDFDKRLKQQTDDRLSANKKVNSDRVRRLAAEFKLEKRKQDKIEKAEKKRQDEIKKRRKEALSNAIIGGAFPLLFGQGLGAAVGGGAGGALGGLAGGQFGFGLSLVGTALGTVFDGLVDGAKRLGKALNPLTADVNAIVEATGQTDTVLGKLLVAYGDQDRAVELLSATIGKKSVTDLRRYGENVTKLTQEFSKSVTQLQVALLPLLNKVTKFLASQARNTRLDQAVFRGTFTGVELNTAFQNDPELIKAVEKFNKGLISEKELVFLGRRIALQRELGKELQLELQLRTKAVNETARSVQIERGRLALQAIGDNPFSQAKFELQEQVALQEKLIRDQQLLSEAKKDPLKAAQLQNNLALSQIKYESELAVIAKNKTAAEIKGINERYRLTKQLFSLEGKAVNANLQRLNDYANVLTRLNSALTSKISAAELLDEAILETSLVGGLEIDKITTQESGVIDALKRKIGDGTNLGSLDVQRFAELQSGVRSEEEIRAIDERFDTLKNVAKFEAKARTSILTIRKEELIAQERLEQSQRRAAFATEKSTLEARIKSPFGGDKFEQDLLGIEQLNRRTKELGELQADIDTKERAANKLRALGYLDTADRVDVEAKALRSRLTLREQEIAQIEELELAQLKLAQTVENVYGFVGPAVSSLIGGFQEVIAGTKCVEEAFADFLKTIADQLLQTAATMIAQYIALGIARAFALGSSPQTPSFTAGLGTGLPLFGDYTGLSGNPFKGLANGGPATANSPYIVGERGPELFVPNSSGNVIPNDALGGTVINITNNISDEGSTSKTDAAGSAKSAADQLSKLMVAVIQREQRPGGVLSRR